MYVLITKISFNKIINLYINLKFLINLVSKEPIKGIQKKNKIK
jgi:hypothetical protein